MKNHDKLSPENNENVKPIIPVSDTEKPVNETAFDKTEMSSQEDIQTDDLDKSLAETQDNELIKTADDAAENIDKKLNKKAKKSNGNKSQKGKAPWYKRIIPLAVVIVVGIISGAVLGTWYFKSSQLNVPDYSGIKEEELVDNTMTILQDILGKTNPSQSELDNWVEFAKNKKHLTPADLTPSQNVLLCEYNASKAKTFDIEANGKVATIANQSVYSRRRFNGELYTFESISKGTMNLADCSIMTKGASTISLVKGTSIQQTSAVWNGKRSEYTLKEYEDMAGTTIDVLNPYIISSKTVIEEREKKKVEVIESVGESGKKLYTFTFTLDPVTSVIKYVRQVKMTSGLGDFPVFKDVTQTFTIDEDWNLVQSDILEHYSVFYIVKASCTGTLTTKFNFNVDVTMPEILA